LKIIPYGDQPLTASYQLVGLGGTVAEGGGDTVSLDFSHADLTGSPITVTYMTTGHEQTYAAVGAGLVQAILDVAELTSFGIWAGVIPSGLMIAMPSRTSATATSKARGDIVRGCAQGCCTARCLKETWPSRS